jgi:hypothetical protein
MRLFYLKLKLIQPPQAADLIAVKITYTSMFPAWKRDILI